MLVEQFVAVAIAVRQLNERVGDKSWTEGPATLPGSQTKGYLTPHRRDIRPHQEHETQDHDNGS